MGTINIYDAKTNLSRLIARVERGDEITISRAGMPVARLVPIRASRGERVLGMDAGAGWIADDFDAPLPADLLAEFER
mgnify:FL=1